MGATALALAAALTLPALVRPATAAVAPVGNGFVVTASDIAFILKQIKIAERHSATLTPANQCGTLVGPEVDQVPDVLTTYGLRTVDGSCNNLIAGRERLSAADELFPRLATPTFTTADATPPGFPPGNANPTTYDNLSGLVYDAQPRVASNLIVDQTASNPAAIAAAGHPVRSQNNPGLFPCTTDPDPTVDPPVLAVPKNCVPSHQTLFIPNVTTDVGLSPPYNSLFTFFGQFFDHGVDQTVKTGGTVFVPLKADDPLILVGPDGIKGTNCGTATALHCDEVPPSQAFMVLTRSTKDFPGPDKVLGTADDVRSAVNTDSPWVDQSQTYTSHASHQVFLREYADDAAGHPQSTGRLLGGLPAGQTYAGSPDGTTGISTWKNTKKQAAERLGLQLVDTDVTNIPLLATDPYGNFLPGLHGLPQYVTTTGLVEGDRAADSGKGVPVPANALHFDTPFLTDIAHNADPSQRDTNNDGVPDTFPTPDADNTPSADFANQPGGTYDDEMLNAHFTCGDGRCNENIALSTIHQVFHSEHDRLVGDIQATLDDPANAGLKADFLAAHPFPAAVPATDTAPAVPAGPDVSFGTGGRLFQAARFVTEMEYQHLVFEEFARKLVPGVRPFHVYTPDINPAIEAEFAHAVYRFGHSMLDDDVARSGPDQNPNGTLVDHSIPLLKAFLNPPEFLKPTNAAGTVTNTLTPEQAAGAVVMGSSDQVANELDEFVTETLRNNLLGLPLDLPTLNMARAREAGVPRLNGFRRQVFAQTNDNQLTPYKDWSDFGQHLKHPESLINFVAAYGKHPTVVGATTLAAKRLAARAIVDPRPAVLDTSASPTVVTTPADVQPADSADFMLSNGSTWGNVNGVTVTGLDDVDLWVGGLAEVTNLFGSLIGSTFNYVFQTQLEKLQDGDRFYYLARTPGMNLRTQLEGNSFSELIGRNTEGTNTLKADAFATADCKFQLGNDNGTPAGFTSFGATVADDPSTTDCDESLLLTRSPDGTLSYKQRNTVDPSGINGQSVYNGAAGADRINGGNDNDTFWGGPGKDVIDGQGGDDIALGGEGNDIITDSAGADVPKGGPGNDAIDGGPGDDIPMGNDGQDFINGGANDNETFAGPGNDFVIAGQGADAVFGDGGDDWIQGGTGQDLLQGDHGAPFFDDPAQVKPGNDIFVGQAGENDYDAEGGDDIMSQNSFVDRNAGAGGFDWAIHQYNTVAADDDMEINNNLVGVPIQLVVNRDRWQETEADSGAGFNDVIKGTSTAPASLGGAGFTGCDAIDAAGVGRIKGLDALITPGMLTTPLAPIVAASAAKACPLTGPVWGAGDILIGGLGSDTITGRGADDVIDGDRYLTVAITVTDGAGVELGRTDLMENVATSGTFGPGTAGMTLQQAVFAGLVDPGNLVAVREIVTPTVAAGDCAAAAPVNCDTAVFSGPLSNYTVTPGIGVVTVNQTGANVVGQKITDGVDTVRNMEQLRFTNADGTFQLLPVSSSGSVGTVPGAPAVGTATAANATASVTWSAPASDGGSPITGYEIDATGGTPAVTTTVTAVSTARTATVSGLTNGTAYTLKVRALNANGASASSASSNAVTPSTVPDAPTIGTATPLNASATVTFTAPAFNGGSAITGYRVDAFSGAVLVSTTTATASPATVTGLTNGTSYTFRVRALNVNGTSVSSTSSNAVVPRTVPGAPTIGTAVRGASTGAPVNATAVFSAPASNGASVIISYTITAQVTSANGRTVIRTFDTTVPAPAVSTPNITALVPFVATDPLTTFTVKANNAAGSGPLSGRSNAVQPR